MNGLVFCFLSVALLLHRGRVYRRMDGRPVFAAQASPRGLHHVPAEQTDQERRQKLRHFVSLCRQKLQNQSSPVLVESLCS